MPITDEHRKEAEKGLFGIFGIKGLTAKEKNQLFKEAIAKRRAEAAKNTPEYFTKNEIAKGRMSGESSKDFRNRIKPFEHPKPTFTQGADPYTQNIDTKTPEQKQNIKDTLKLLEGKWGPLLDQMAQSPKTKMSGQIEDWFSHMNNPIVQSMINQGYRTNPEVLFPSELGQHDSNRQLEALLSGLGQQYGPDIINYGYDKASEYLPQAYQSAKQLPGQIGGGLMSILSNLGNRFRSQ